MTALARHLSLHIEINGQPERFLIPRHFWPERVVRRTTRRSEVHAQLADDLSLNDVAEDMLLDFLV